MEVSGRMSSDNKHLSLAKGSADEFEFSCQPCACEGHHVEAAGFCQNCQEYLCITCYKCHCKPTPSRHHVLLDKDNMPRDRAPTSTKHGCTLTCTKHVSEIVKFFCKQHDEIGCGDCMILDHKSCKVDYIPDISKDFVNGQEYVELVSKAKQLETNVTSIQKEIEEDLNEVDILYVKAVSDIRSFRKQVDKYLEDMEQKLLNQCEKLKRENGTMLKDLKEKLRPMKRELEGINSRLTSQAKKSGDVFVQAKQMSNRLKTVGEELKCLDAKNEASMYTFDKNNKILDYLMEKQGYLGDLRSVQIKKRQVMSPRHLLDLSPTLVGEINVKSSHDKRVSWITGILFIASDTLVCTDNSNNSVKLIDIKADNITSELKLACRPWDITYVSYDQLAVTVTEEKKIHFLSFRSGLSKTRSIDVGGKCDGIAYTMDRLVVTFILPRKVEILSLDGKVIQRVDTDSSGGALFQFPRYVAVDSDGNSIYVSDWMNNSVTKVTISGKVLAIYKDGNLKYPEGITVCSDGSVVVCNSGNDNLHLLSSECKKIMTILDNTVSPQVLCFDNETGVLFMRSSSWSKRAKVLQFKFT